MYTVNSIINILFKRLNMQDLRRYNRSSLEETIKLRSRLKKQLKQLQLDNYIDVNIKEAEVKTVDLSAMNAKIKYVLQYDFYWIIINIDKKTLFYLLKIKGLLHHLY